MRTILSVLATIYLSTFLGGCASAPKPPQTKADSPAVLTEKEARFRAQQVSDVRYNLFFDLISKENYSGTVQLNFELNKIYEGLRIDFFDGTVSSVTMNGQVVDFTYNGHYILIAKEILDTGLNSINVVFTKKYSKNGSGLHHFIDDVDNNRYLYTDFEPFDANNMFPCFDQPDIKATYSLKVKTPKNWKVITSVREQEIKKESEHQLWIFPESAKFSTYIWSLHAGNYKTWESNAGDIPLRLFARQSLAKHIKPNDWFQFTKEGFEFFNEYFDYKYPYKKYDQVIVPEFNSGAMENVAAVTFSERFTSRGEKSSKARQSLNYVIHHEMAHMWFGNLVTMKWWDDLWLNESFATYMGHLAQASIGEFKNTAWVNFIRTKKWAYGDDQLVTTHPIEAEVPDTISAKTIFDGITYGKGASSLKQMAYYIGAENFKSGTRAYFKKYAGGNTQLKDFMAAMDATTDKDLGSWQKLWLQTSGVNFITADFSCKKNKVTHFALKQTADQDHNHIRPHAMQVALLNQKEQNLFVEKVLKVYIKEESTEVPEAIDLPCPKIVYPNYNDHAYVKIQLDPTSLGHLKHGISNVEDSFLRRMFWNTLWDMVVHAKLSFEAYGEILLTGSLRNETDPFVLRDLIDTLGVNGNGSRSSIIGFYAIKDGISSKSYKRFVARAEQLIWRRLKKAKPGSEQQKIFFDGFIQVAETPLAKKRLRQVLDGKSRFKKLKVDQDKRWSIILQLAATKYPSAKSLIKREAQKDKSHTGLLYKVSSEAALPNWEKKQGWIKKYTDKETKESFAVLRSAVYNLFPHHQSEFRKKFASEFYPHLKKLSEGKESFKARTFTALTPNECQHQDVNKISNFINANPNLNPTVMKSLLNSRQRFERCKKAIELARSKKFTMK